MLSIKLFKNMIIFYFKLNQNEQKFSLAFMLEWNSVFGDRISLLAECLSVSCSAPSYSIYRDFLIFSS